MTQNDTIIQFRNVSFDYGYKKEILEEVDFSIRRGMKIALMGQNGAGKSTIFKIMTGQIRPSEGTISIDRKLKVATAHQVITAEDQELTTEAYFHKHSGLQDYELHKEISIALDVVNLTAPLDKLIKSYSGGQQARLLLAAAVIQSPDLLLLDEPTNNFDKAGIEHLTQFLMYYPNTCIVISHDADFLHAFTDGVLYLDAFNHNVEYFAGSYYDVVVEIASRVEKQTRLNARMKKGILANKEKANFFAHKGGKMRLVAKKMREKAEKMEHERVDIRREDKTIRNFVIPQQTDLMGTRLTITGYSVIKDHEVVSKTADIVLNKNQHLLISGRNGIGKSTLIESIAMGTNENSYISPGVRVGYYRQDFSTLNFEDTVYQSFVKTLVAADGVLHEEELRSVAAGFLINSDIIGTRIGHLSEGQKGLVAFAQLVMQKPGLLILDEPTNHINFRHIPVIASALHTYEGAMILVSHVPEFVSQIRIDKELDLEQ